MNTKRLCKLNSRNLLFLRSHYSIVDMHLLDMDGEREECWLRANRELRLWFSTTNTFCLTTSSSPILQIQKKVEAGSYKNDYLSKMRPSTFISSLKCFWISFELRSSPQTNLTRPYRSAIAIGVLSWNPTVLPNRFLKEVSKKYVSY